MALKSVLVTADGGRKVVELSSQNALSLQPGERLLIPDGLERLPVAPGSEFDNAMMLQDAEGQQYSIFLSADTEVVVAEAEDLQVAEAETPDAEYEDLSRPGGAPETAPVEDVGAPPNVVGDPPPPVGPQNYGANPNSPVVYEQDQGAGNFVLPMLGGIIGAGALIALANENEDESDERREESPAPNAPPIIASNGGGDSAQISIAENNQAVTTVSALDPDLNAVSYGLAGGADAALFSINSITGALSLLNPPDFENPLDAGGDNVYEVSVLATDGVLADFQSLSVQVVNSGSEPNQAPVITSGDDDLFALNIAEQAELNVAITAQDPDGDDITLSVIGGADANRFVFDADTGLLTLPAQDFENPLDANGDNRYVIVIQAADEQDADAQIVIVTVTDIDDGDPNLNLAPVITSNGGGVSAVVPVAENTTAVTQVVASDANGDAITYSIAGGADAGLFSVDANTGALSFNAAPDFEMPADANADNDYFVVVSASDGVLSDAQALTVSVTDVVEMAPNNPPVAVNDAASTDQDMAVTIVNVLLNDSDPDQALTAANINAFSQGGNGSVASNGDGSFLYTPNAGFSGVDSFSYTVTDDQGASDTATVTVTVNAAGGGNTAPVAVADSYNVVQDTAFMIDAVGGVLANDSDAENDTLSAALVSDVASGSLSLATDGSFSYTPNGGFTGTDSFSYKASDGTVDGNTVTVTLSVGAPANVPATITGDTSGIVIEQNAGHVGSFLAAGDLDSTDPDNPDDLFQAVSTPSGTSNNYGTYTVTDDGRWLYALNNDNAAVEALAQGGTPLSDSFTVLSDDGTAQVVSITINGVSDAPFAQTGLANVIANSGGFAINPVADGDQLGHTVSHAGDFNGDGFDDILVGAREADPGGNSEAGQAHLIFGGSNLSGPLNLASLGAQGVSFSGLEAGDNLGQAVAGGGDVNGDGFADIMIGNNSQGLNEVFVVFGGASGAASIADIDAGNGGGFVIRNVDIGLGSNFHNWISTGGDVNGDGLHDIIVGSPLSDPGGNSAAGETFVVFGRTEVTAVDLADIRTGNSQGYVIRGVDIDDDSGRQVSIAGDVNGDGLEDLIIAVPDGDPGGNSNFGESYVVFGQSGTTPVELSAVAAGTGGFIINGVDQVEQDDLAVSGAGDVNGDGLDDLLVGNRNVDVDGGGGSNEGQSYVVFGKTNGTVVNLSDIINGVGGFVINGITGGGLASRSGQVLDAAGDVNGDGLADIIIGAPSGDPPGFANDGQAYVVFGRTDTSAIDVNDIIAGQGGFVINGVAPDNGNSGVTDVSGAGDINGDGFDDLLIGGAGVASGVDGSGTPNTGQAYVVYGGDFLNRTPTVTTGNGNLSGTEGEESLIGGAGDDVLDGGRGNDVLIGAAGDDVLIYDIVDVIRVDGGLGNDTLRAQNGDDIDFTAIHNLLITGIEQIDLETDTASNEVSLEIFDVLDLSDTSNRLLIFGDTGDVVDLGVGINDSGADDMIDGRSYDIYAAAGTDLDLWIDQDISVV